MSWLFFQDESGHDHRNTPYEVRGGVAIHARELWAFVQDLQRLEVDAFGIRASEIGKELKGATLLAKDRFLWAKQDERMSDEARRKHARGFLIKGQQRAKPIRIEFTAYGQACMEMAVGTFQLLRDHRAVLFAAAIPRGVTKPDTAKAEVYLRKDHVFLLERFFYFLERQREHGLLVMDEVEKSVDRRFVRRLEAYFTKTLTGRYRTTWIVPTPFFVSSDMAYPVQAADLCIYCVNWGFRLPRRGMDAETRAEIAEHFGLWLNQLQFRGEGSRDGSTYEVYGIIYVPDPYEATGRIKKEVMPSAPPESDP